MIYFKKFRKHVRRAMELNNPASRLLAMAYRSQLAFRYSAKPLSYIPAWLVSSREITNFTFDLTPRNMRYLASVIALVSGEAIETVSRFLAEPALDTDLKRHIQDSVAASPLRSVSDSTTRFGRRLGWYAMARCMKPRVIVETGVDKGLGSVILCSALLRNAEEGHGGQYFGTDINPQAGYMLHGKYASVGKILYGDSITSLEAMKAPIDLFINDSDHSADYELAEYETIENKLSERAVIIGDNAECTDSLWKFSVESEREFLFFAEQPDHHWYPGGGIAFSFHRLAPRAAGETR